MKTFRIPNNTAIHILLIALTGLMAYANTFHAQFVFDDVPNISENPLIFNLGNFVEPAQLWGNRYIGYLSFALNYAVSGLNVTGYHVVNLAIHICAACLVYLLVTMTFETPFFTTRKDNGDSTMPVRFIALISALIFVAHPIQTQAVTYVVQRFTSLAAMFYLAALVLYIKARLTGNGRCRMYYLLGICAAILAMKTKEIDITLPVAIVLYELMFFSGAIKKRLIQLTPFILTMFIIPLPLLISPKTGNALISGVSNMTRADITMPRLDYLCTQFRVITTYLRLLFLPINQTLDYDYPVYTSFFAPQVLASFLLLLLIAAFGCYLLLRASRVCPETRLIAFGIFWFFLTLSVESSLIPISDVIYEHRIYLPSVGFIIATITGIMILLRRFSAAATAPSGEVVIGFTVLVIITSITCFSRNRVWENNVNLWGDVVSKNPGKARGHNNLGFAFATVGNQDAAVQEYREALRIDPGYADAHFNLGLVYAGKWNFDDAIMEFRETLRLTPHYTKAHNNLGLAMAFRGDTQTAIHEYREALRLSPNSPEVHVNLGAALAYMGDLDAAIREYREALRINPDNSEAHNSLGSALANKGELDAAISEYQLALQLTPDNAGARKNLEQALARKGTH